MAQKEMKDKPLDNIVWKTPEVSFGSKE